MAEEEFECPECGKVFETEKGLSIHKTKVHGEEEEVVEIEEPAEELEEELVEEPEEDPDIVVIQNVKNDPRVKISLNLERPILEEGKPVTFDRRHPDEAPTTVHPTDETTPGDVEEYRTRRGQQRMKGYGETIYLQARGKENDSVEVERDVLRSSDIQAKLNRGDLRIVSE